MYIFLSFDDDGSVWSEVQKLLPSDGAGQDTFGSSVSVYAGILAVGSSGNLYLYILVYIC